MNRQAPPFWSVLFPGIRLESARITVEIGSAWGEYLTKRASTEPQQYFVGTDRLPDRCESHARKAKNLGLLPDRYKILTGPVHSWFPLVPEGSIHELVTLYPDPWPKRRHAQHRLFSPQQLPLLLSRLAPGGTWLFVTDMELYWKDAERQLAPFDAELELIAADHTTLRTPRSEFERRCLSRGLPIFEWKIHVKSETNWTLASLRERWAQEQIVPVHFTVGQAL